MRKPVLTVFLVMAAILLFDQLSQASLRISPATKTVNVGDEFTLDIVVEDVQDLFGASFELAFDGSVLEVIDATPGDLLGEDAVFFEMSDTNAVSVSVTRRAGSLPVSGTGVLAAITFRAKAPGTTDLTFLPETLVLQQADGSPVPGFHKIIIQGATVSVTRPGTLATTYVDASIGSDDYDGSSPDYGGGNVGPKATIQAGIDATGDGGTCNVAAGSYHEAVSISGLTLIGEPAVYIPGKKISLIGAGADRTIIEGPETSGNIVTLLEQDSTTAIQGFTILMPFSTNDFGIYCVDSSPAVANNVIIGNANNEGGIACSGSSSPAIVNNTIVNNEDCGIGCDGSSSPVIMNNIIANNGIGVFLESGSSCYPVISYNDFWSNIYHYYDESTDRLFSPSPGTGEIHADPRFVAPGDYHLMPTSPCTDAGNPDPAYNDPNDSRNDMGAYGGPSAKGRARAPDLVMLFSPTEMTATVSDQFALEVVLENATNLFGATFEMGFDGNVLEAVDASPGDLLGEDIIFFSMPETDSISVSVTKMGGSASVSGTGVLARVTFKAKSAGTTDVSFLQDTLSLQQADGSPIPQFGDLDLGKCHVTVKAVDFGVQVEPAEAVVAVGGQSDYRISVTNRSPIRGDFDISVSDNLDPSLYSLSRHSLTLPPGGSEMAILEVHIPGDYKGAEVVNFQVYVESQGRRKGVPCVLHVRCLVSGLLPEDGAVLSSNDVIFVWNTNIASTSEVYVKADGEADYKLYTGDVGEFHTVTVPGLGRDTQYSYYVKSSCNTCAMVSEVRSFYIKKGIEFSRDVYSFTIERDYDQRVSIAVSNLDSQTHDLLVIVENPYPDIAIGFVGRGGDEVVSVGPGQSKDVVLAIHAQDTRVRDYQFVLELESMTTEGSLLDMAILEVHVDAPVIDYEIVELGTEPGTLIKNYRIINRGDTITDLKVSADENLGNTIVFQPSIQHGRLPSGGSMDFKAIPLLSFFAKAPSLPRSGNIIVAGAGSEKTVTADFNCLGEETLHCISFENMMLIAQNADWYCTNRPSIQFSFKIPAGFDYSDIEKATLVMNFAPKSNVNPHDVRISLNENVIGEIENSIPCGEYVFDIVNDDNGIDNRSYFILPPDIGMATNTIRLDTFRHRGGHYIVASGFELHIAIKKVTLCACALTEDEARAILMNRMEYFVPQPESWEIGITSPTEGQELKMGTPFVIQAYSPENVSGLYVVASFSNGDAAIRLGDLGNGEYSGQWTPRNPGERGIGSAIVTVTAGACRNGEAQCKVKLVEPIFVSILSPEEGFRSLLGEQVTIRAEVLDYFGAQVLDCLVSATFSNGHEALTLYDDGEHNDEFKNDGICANTWVPRQLGECIITAEARKGSVSDYDSVAGYVRESDEEIARRFLPNIYQSQFDIDDSNPERDNGLVKIGYYISDEQNGKVRIEYGLVFKDEDDANLDELYDFFRKEVGLQISYSPLEFSGTGRLEDIETFAITVDLRTQEINRVDFRSTSEYPGSWADDWAYWDPQIFKHNIIPWADREFTDIRQFEENNGRINIYVATWNHLLSNRKAVDGPETGWVEMVSRLGDEGLVSRRRAELESDYSNPTVDPLVARGIYGILVTSAGRVATRTLIELGRSIIQKPDNFARVIGSKEISVFLSWLRVPFFLIREAELAGGGGCQSIYTVVKVWDASANAPATGARVKAYGSMGGEWEEKIADEHGEVVFEAEGPFGTEAGYPIYTVVIDHNGVKEILHPDNVSCDNYIIASMNPTVIDAEITDYVIDSGVFGRGDEVNAQIAIKNTGSEEHEFYVGYSVRSKDEQWWDAPYGSINLSPNEEKSIILTWTVASSAPEGKYDARVAVWQGEAGGLLIGRRDYKEQESAFEILDYPPWDVDGNGIVDVSDLVIVGRYFGQPITIPMKPNPDVNRDGIVDMEDLNLVAMHLGEVYQIPVPTAPTRLMAFNGASVYAVPQIQRVDAIASKLLVIDVHTNSAAPILGAQFDVTFDPRMLEVISVSGGSLLRRNGNSIFWHPPRIDGQAGIVKGAACCMLGVSKPVEGDGVLATITFRVKETSEEGAISIQNARLVSADARPIIVETARTTLDWDKLLTPEKTALLQNFPNPFNPETWIPYQLAESATTVIDIYSVSGQLVRRLDLGHCQAGIYTSKERAAYWDGRNLSGERVASGTYFYRLQAEGFTAVRKFVILK